MHFKDNPDVSAEQGLGRERGRPGGVSLEASEEVRFEEATGNTQALRCILGTT